MQRARFAGNGRLPAALRCRTLGGSSGTLMPPNATTQLAGVRLSAQLAGRQIAADRRVLAFWLRLIAWYKCARCLAHSVARRPPSALPFIFRRASRKIDIPISSYWKMWRFLLRSLALTHFLFTLYYDWFYIFPPHDIDDNSVVPWFRPYKFKYLTFWDVVSTHKQTSKLFSCCVAQ